MKKKLAGLQASRDVFISALDSLDKQGNVINGNLQATVNNLVRGIDLRSIEHSGKDLNIRGWSPTEVEILEYARNLDTSGRFTEVTITNILRIEEETEGDVEENEVMDFTLSLKLKGPK